MVTAFKGTVTLQFADGTREGVNYASDDTAGNAYTWAQTGAADYQISSKHGMAWIVDITVTIATATSTLADIYVNDKSTGVQMVLLNNYYAVVGRQFQGQPLGSIAPGARIKIIARA